MLRSGFFPENTLGDGPAFWIFFQDSRIRVKECWPIRARGRKHQFENVFLVIIPIHNFIQLLIQLFLILKLVVPEHFNHKIQ